MNILKRREFEKELTKLINKYSAENESNTPDFILSRYIMLCLETFHVTSQAREDWYDVHHKPGQSK